MGKKGGPKTSWGKRVSSLNSSRHYFRRAGIRPCSQSCPFWNNCEERLIGHPCAIEAREFANFVDRLSTAFDLAGDVAGLAHVQVLAGQMLRIRRANQYLASLENGGWGDKTKEYILKELRNLEVAFIQGLAQLRKHKAASAQTQVMELRILDPIEEPDGN